MTLGEQGEDSGIARTCPGPVSARLGGWGGVLLILPCRDLVSLGKACGWTAVGSDRCSGGPEGHLGGSTGDRRCSEWAGQASLSGIWVALRLGGLPSSRRGTAEALWLRSEQGRGRAVGRKASRRLGSGCGPVCAPSTQALGCQLLGSSLGCERRYMEGQEQSRPSRRQGAQGTVVTSCCWRKGGLPVPLRRGLSSPETDPFSSVAVPPAGASLRSRSVTVSPSGAVGCTYAVWRERRHGEVRQLAQVTEKISVATGTEPTRWA